MLNLRKSIVVLVALILALTPVIWGHFWTPVRASVGSCAVGVDPTNISPNSSGALNFTIGNDGWLATIVWVKITAPSSNFTITSGTKSGWSASVSGSSVTFTGGTQNVGVSTGYVVNVTTGVETAQAGWTIQTSDSADGSGAVTCTGTTQVAISNSAADTTGPSIGDAGVAITGLSDTSVGLTWTTNESATSVVNYGTSDSYGSSATETTAVTSHSVTLSSLSANTTYHFNIILTDAYGNSSETGDNTFTISKGGTTTVTTTTTKTDVVTKLVQDTTLPAVRVSTNLNGIYKETSEISGTASDNAGISAVEYSIDDGKNWSTAFLEGKVGAKSVGFSFTPDIFDDGNYKLKVRATDTSGNTKTSAAIELIIDRLPPIIGASMFSLGPLILNPDEAGFIITTGIEQNVTLSAGGGPTSIILLSDGGEFPLAKSPETGLWTGKVSFKNPGIYEITSKSVDGAENKTDSTLASMVVIRPGIVMDKTTQKGIQGAKVRLYSRDNFTGLWYLWEGSPFNQEAPQATDENGYYHFFLPPGEYYFKVEAPGYNGVVSKIFKLSKTTPINSNFELTKKNFPIQFNWEKVDISINIPAETNSANPFGHIINQQTDEFAELRGKPTLVSFLNTSFPLALDQINILDETYKVNKSKFNFAAVVVQEKSSKVEVFQKRGGYSLPFITDTNGTIANSFKVTTVPTHVFLNQRGVIQKVITRVLTETEIEEIFEEL